MKLPFGFGHIAIGLLHLMPLQPGCVVVELMPPVRLNEVHKREPSLLKWGLVPSLAKEPSIGYKMINARAETLCPFVSALRMHAAKQELPPLA